MRSWLATLFVCLALVSTRAFAQPDEHPAKAELIANVTSIKPGEPFTVGIRFTMKPHWHVYWINPGDSGIPPQVKWKLPEGFSVSELQFPVPKKFQQPGDMGGYGYEDEVLLTATVTPPTTLKTGTTVPITADVSWMVCDDEMCLLGDAALSIELAVSESVTPLNQEIFKIWRDRMPEPAEDLGAKVGVGADRQRTEFQIIIDWPGPAPAHAEWFPPAASEVDWRDVKVTRDGNRTVVSTRPKFLAGKVPPTTPLESLLAYDASDGTRRGVVASFTYPRQTIERN